MVSTAIMGLVETSTVTKGYTEDRERLVVRSCAWKDQYCDHGLNRGQGEVSTDRPVDQYCDQGLHRGQREISTEIMCLVENMSCTEDR